MAGRLSSSSSSSDSLIETKIRQVELSLKKTGNIPMKDIEKEMKLSDRMKDYLTSDISIALINEGKLEWARTYTSYGETSSEGQPLFQAASTSKPIAALVALKVAEEKKLDLDEDVNKIFERYGSTYRIPASEYTSHEKVTLRRLLSHTAGLNVHGFSGYPSETKELPTTQQILTGAAPAVNPAVTSEMKPGEKYQYSGGGTTVVQLLLETVTREKFPAIARKYVLDPLEMKSSGFEIHRPGDPGFAPCPPYDCIGRKIPGTWRIYPESAAAGLWTTASDMAHFVIELEKAYRGEDSKVISPDVARAMLTPQTMEGRGPDKSKHFGLGVELERKTTDGLLEFWHGGANAGYRCYFGGFPERGKAVVIMTNSDNGSKLIDEICQGIGKVYEWPKRNYINPFVPAKVNPEIYQNYIGEFKLENGAPISILFTLENEKLFITFPFPFPQDPPKKFELIALSETSFIHVSDIASFEMSFPSSKEKANTFSSFFGETKRITPELKRAPMSDTARTTKLLGITPGKLPEVKLVDEKKEASRSASVSLSDSRIEADITDEEMSNSAFGQSSDTAKKIKK